MTRKALLTALLVPAVAFALESPLPSNLDPGRFRPALEEMSRASETFRRQCDRLRAAPYLRITVESELHGSRRYRARTRFVRTSDVSVHAIVTISTVERVVEVLAHELEHVLEHLDGVDLKRSSRHVSESEGGFETRRAIEIGRMVADEVERARKTSLWSSSLR